MHIHASHGQPVDFNRNGVMLHFPCGGAAGTFGARCLMLIHNNSGIPPTKIMAKQKLT